MKQIKIIEEEEFKVLSSSEKCYKCLFQCKVIIKEKKRISLSCKHPKGPGNHMHCIYFKNIKLEK
jgi:hypothetical protein